MLIEVTDIKTYQQFPLTDDSERKVEPMILEAEKFDIEPQLGKSLYRDMVENIQSQKYQDLLIGKEYENCDGELVKFEGLKPAICYYAYARLVERDPVMTEYGLRRKITPYGQPPDAQTLKSTINTLRSGAANYMVDVIEFLNTNKETYPFWKLVKVKSSIKINRI